MGAPARIALACCLAAAMLLTACGGREEKPAVTLVEVSAANCEPCTRMEGVLKEVEQRYRGRVRIETIDARSDAGMIYARRYGLRVVPTQLILDANGLELLRHEGALTPAELFELLSRAGVK